MAKIYNKIIEKDGKFYQITATAEVIPDERPRIDLKKVAALNINASNAEDIINSLNKDYKPIAKYGEDGFLCTGPGYGGTLKFYSCLAKDVCGNFGGIEKTPGLIKSRGKFLFPDKIYDMIVSGNKPSKQEMIKTATNFLVYTSKFSFTSKQDERYFSNKICGRVAADGFEDCLFYCFTDNSFYLFIHDANEQCRKISYDEIDKASILKLARYVYTYPDEQ